MANQKKIQIKGKELEIPEFFYLCRQTNSLLHSFNNRINSVPIKGDLTICQDSVIGLIKKLCIIVIGGIKPNKKLTKKVYAINVLTKSIHNLSKFPKKITNGFIFYYNTLLYVILTDPLEIFSYDFTGKTWRLCELIFSQEKYSSLSKFSCFQQKNKIFLVCGSFNSKVTTKIFYVNLCNLKVKQHRERFPEILYEPICLSKDDYIIMCGGYTENHTVNKRFFYKNNTEEQWQSIQGPDIEILENYPPVMVGESCIFFSFPKIIIKSSSIFTVINITSNLQPGSNLFTHESGKKSINSERSTYQIKGMIQRHISYQFVSSMSSSESNSPSSQSLPSEEFDFGYMNPVISSAKPKKSRDYVIPIKCDFKAPFLPSNVEENLSPSSSELSFFSNA